MATTLDLASDDFVHEPWTYPGKSVDHSGVLYRGCLHSMEPRPRRRLGKARVVKDQEFSRASLNEFLLRANVASVDHRTLVVAVGSNASPVVMHRKFDRKSVSTTVPFVSARVTGIAIGHSAHISRRGYIAASPFANPDTSSQVTVSLLDREQLQCLDETEPNYERREIDASQFPLVLHRGEHPEKYCIYISRWGVLTDADGESVQLRSQDDIYSLVFSRASALRGLVSDTAARSAMTELATNEVLREGFRDAIKAEALARPSGLEAVPSTSAQAYGATFSRWEPDHCPPSLRCLPSSDDIRRVGQQCVVVNPDDHESLLQRATHAAVRTCEEPRVAPALTRVIADDTQARGTVGIDQIVRYAVGAELQERVELSPARPRATPFTDRLLARPQFATMRVQPGDLAIVEQGVCLMDELSMKIIGVDDGAEVVIEGAPATGEEVRQVRLQAHATPEDTADRRVGLSGGDLEARFPSAEDALGITPDLPWIFLDSAARSALGLERKKLGTVRVRASRRYQIFKELRELLFVLVLALVGIANVIHHPLALILIAVFFMACIGWALRHRLKSRLEATS